SMVLYPSASLSSAIERAIHVLLRRFRSGLPADPRQSLWPSHQGRSALQGEEYSAGGAARLAALSGHAAAVAPDSARLRFRYQRLCAACPYRGPLDAGHRKVFRRAATTSGKGERLSEDVDARSI